MSGYTPQVGDTVRLDRWHPSQAEEVLCVGQQRWMGRDLDGEEYSHPISIEPNYWVKVEPVTPLPDQWCYILDSSYVGSGHETRQAALEFAQCHVKKGSEVIAMIHIWSDEDGDHSQIERIEQ